MVVSQNEGYQFGGPNSKDYSILGSILGSPHFGKPPNHASSLPAALVWNPAVLSQHVLDPQVEHKTAVSLPS